MKKEKNIKIKFRNLVDNSPRGEWNGYSEQNSLLKAFNPTLDELMEVALDCVAKKEEEDNNRCFVVGTGKLGAIRMIENIFEFYYKKPISKRYLEIAEELLPEGCYKFVSSIMNGFTSPEGDIYDSIFNYINKLRADNFDKEFNNAIEQAQLNLIQERYNLKYKKD
jgi:hypothetical protein